VSSKREAKLVIWEKLWKLLEDYPVVLIVNADNVGSKQMQDVRKALRGKAEVLFGKNTLIRKGIKMRMEKPKEDDKRKTKWYPMEQLAELIPLIKGNVGLIFCKTETGKILDIVEGCTVPAEAKPGSIAPCDVIIPSGATGMDPSMTSFFQALGISTKIAKGQIEIVTDIKVVEKDKKVGNSEAVLLKKLNIRPFTYGLKVVSVYDNGSVYEAAVLKLDEQELLKKFMSAVNNLAALSLSAGLPNEASAPHSIIAGFKNLVAMALEADFEFKQGEKLINMVKNPSAFAQQAAAPAAGAKKEEKPAEKEKEEEEVAEVDLGGGMFGDDEW
jgi:large subunit ribosomal protein LP0